LPAGALIEDRQFTRGGSIRLPFYPPSVRIPL
jgi:hypothetical protein